VTSLNGTGPAAAETANGARKVVAVARNNKPSSQPKPKRQGQLADLAQRIQAEHQAVIAAIKSSAEHAMAAGDLLIEAKAKVSHGGWQLWLKEHCAFSERTAQLYMWLAENRAAIEAKAQRVADLTLRGAVKAIATPEPRTEVATPQSTSRLAHTIEQQKPKRVTHRDLLALWLILPADERRPFFDAIGLRTIIECVPESWKEALRRESVA
jgi:hypothetical protein